MDKIWYGCPFINFVLQFHRNYNYFYKIQFTFWCNNKSDAAESDVKLTNILPLRDLYYLITYLDFELTHTQPTQLYNSLPT